MQYTSVDQQLAAQFGSYILPGRITDPQRGLDEAKQLEELGLGSAWLSERYALKEPAVACGAITQLTSKIDIVGTFYCHMRHPVVTASIANMLHALSGERFGMLLAKAIKPFFDALGMGPITFKMQSDFIDIMHRLWRGETVNYKGILGEFPKMRLTDYYQGSAPPIYLTAIGPKSLAFAGQHADGVLLHPLLTCEAVKRSVAIVREAAERAGRRADTVKIWANVVASPDLPLEQEAAVVGGRAITYLQAPALGDVIVEANGWDKTYLDNIRNHPLMASLGKTTADQGLAKEQLIELAQEIPNEWLVEGNALGTSKQCAGRLMDYIASGADAILLHGSAPSEMVLMVAALRNEIAGAFKK